MILLWLMVVLFEEDEYFYFQFNIRHTETFHKPSNTHKNLCVFNCFFNLLIINNKNLFLKTILKTKSRFHDCFFVFTRQEQACIVSIVSAPFVQLFLL